MGPRISRRGFIAGAGAAAAASALAACSGDDDRATGSTTVPETLTTTGPAKGGIDAIEHVVILMQENRSFDHYYGALNGVRGFGDPTPVRHPRGASLFEQPRDGEDGTVLPFHYDVEGTRAGARNMGLAHSWPDAHVAANQGRWDQWCRAKSPASLGYYGAADVPFHHALADAFTICDRHFCSTLAGTNPNRLHLWTGTIDADGTHGGPATLNDKVGELTWTTYPERLEEAGVSWQVYQEEDDFTDNPLEWFPQYLDAPEDSALWRRGVHFEPDVVQWFADDVAGGKLPAVSWIVAPAADSEHPGPSTPWSGADFTGRVLDVLAANPDVWAKTLFLLTYDENDGFFDHVPAPFPAPGTPGEWVNERSYVGLGPRVPLIVASPWSQGGHVCSETLDHTSVIRFLEQWCGVEEPNISEWRRQVCGDLTSALDLTSAMVSFPYLPLTRQLADRSVGRSSPEKPAVVAPDGPGEMPVAEPGTRPARALPYRPDVQGAVVGADLVVTFGNAGATRPVTFEAYETVGGEVTVRPVVVAPDETARVSFAAAAERVDVHGPDGYLRTFEGSTAAPFRVGSVRRHDDGAEIALHDGDGTEAVVTATDIVDDGPWTLPVDGDSSVVVATNEGWYDVTVTAVSAPGFVQRLAGHVDPTRRTVTGVGLTA